MTSFSALWQRNESSIPAPEMRSIPARAPTIAVVALSMPAWASTVLASVAPRYPCVGRPRDRPTAAFAASSIAVSIAPIGVAPIRMSRIAGAPPHTIGAPGAAAWWITIPARHSAACCTTEPASATGAAPPARGIDTIWAGTPARASPIRHRDANEVQSSGGDGHTSKTARGRARSASVPPASTASRSSIGRRPSAVNAPVTTGLSDPSRTRRSR